MSVRALAIRTAAPLLIASSALAFIGTAPARAQSQALDYTCDFFASNGAVADLPLTMTLDTDLENGGTIKKGATVTPHVTGSVVFSAELSDLMIQVAGKSDNWALNNPIDVAETKKVFGASYEPQSTPANTAVPISGVNGSFTASGSDTFTIRAGKTLTLQYPVGDEPEGSVKCTLDAGQDRTIDRVHIATVSAPAPRPTSAPTATPAPRPAVVQTDAAQPTAEEFSWLPMAAAGAGSILALGAGASALRRRAVRR